MIVKINRRNWIVKAMDVESHNDDESIAKKETSIWLGCYIDEESKKEDEESYFYSIEEWLDRLEEETKPKRNKKKVRLCNNLVIYIYNLSFEWSFILPKLLERGFVYNPIVNKDSKEGYIYNSISTKTCSSVWEVNLKFSSKSGLIKIRDLAKQFGGGLGKVAKSFGLETQKGEIDYRLNRLHDYVITDEEKEYCFKDTKILMEILVKMESDKDFWNSISMASYSMKKCLKSGWSKNYKPYQKFRQQYPVLKADVNNFLRRSLEGGITYSPPRWQFVEIDHPILHIDAHQMYPSQMYYKLFPYGEPSYFVGKPKELGMIHCIHCKISYDDVLLHSKVQLIGYDCVSDYDIWLWNFEIETMKKVYVNLKIDYIDGYSFKCKLLPFRNYYKENYLKRKIAKQNKDNFNILYYKLLNNSSYGKFIEKGHEFEFQNIIDDNGIIDSIPISKETDSNARYTYIGIGSCCTAYARCCLIETALKFGWEKILYFDTDSIFVLYDDQTKAIWESMNQEDFLGGWGLEEIDYRAMFSAPKRYKLETNEGKTIVKAGGINFDKYLKDNNLKELEFRETNIISSEWEVQRAYRVKGGTIIDFQKKKMMVDKKYQTIAERNVGSLYRG